ncbi:MAG: S8 family serine peptidase [Gemmatimonadota bacterium]|nr:S8 family serine peptidase [Gemmatimonadota bacterium]
MKRWAPFAVAALTVTACQDASGPGSTLQPVAHNVVSAAKAPIPGSYIIKFRDDLNDQDVDNSARSLVKLHSGALRHLYKSALKGFAVRNLSAAAAAALANDPRVELIEPDQVMTISTTQSGATWGLDRVDQRALKLDGFYTYNTEGAGVTVYIIDTGINFSHPDLEGRAVKGIDEVTTGGTAEDCNGHGTHVSGTVGGKLYGIAKKVSLIGVRVLDCGGSGTTSGVIAGIDWVTARQNCTPPSGTPVGINCGNPAAANMSLGGSKDVLLNQAVAKSVGVGVTYAVAAGNSSADACSSSPSSEPTAITVGATDINDGFASFSNRGSCVDINAPGVNITSDWLSGGTNTISGTSMASPHVAGAAALYLSVNRGASPAAVASALTTNASPFPAAPTGTAKLLLYTAFIASAPPTTAPPAPALSSPTNGAIGVSTSPTLSWNASNTASSYTVQVSTDAAFGTFAYNVSGIAGTSTRVAPALSYATVYYWRATATNSVGTSPASAVFSFTTANAPPPPPPPPAAPGVPVLSAPANGVTGVAVPVTLSWTADPAGGTPASYTVQVSTSSNFTTLFLTRSVTANSTSVTGLAANTVYYWRVNATNTTGTSSFSGARNFRTATAPAACTDGDCQN